MAPGRDTRLRRQFTDGIKLVSSLSAGTEGKQQLDRNAQTWGRGAKEGLVMRKRGQCSSRFSVLPSDPTAPSKVSPCAPEGGRLNSRSSLGNWAAEPLLGLEVTLGPKGKEVDMTMGLSRWHRSELGSNFPSKCPLSPHPLCNDLGSQAGWLWGWWTCRERGKEDWVGECAALWGRAHSALSMGAGSK